MVPKNNRGDLKPRALDQKGLFNLSFAEAKAVNEIVRHPKFGEIPLVYVGMVRGNEGAPVWISSEGLVLLTEWNAR